VNVGTNSTGGKVVLNGSLDSSARVNVLSNSTVLLQSGFSQPASITLFGGDTGESLGQLRVEGEWSGPVALAGPITGAGDGTVGANTALIGTISGPISGSQPLIKVGAGTIIFSGTNTYTSNTIVNAGTLIVMTPTSLPGSTVTVANGAVLQLNFAETNQVAGLVMGGTNQSPGVYSAATSSPFIAGSGSLLVASPVATNPTNITVSVSGSTLNLSWPAEHLGWTLQTNSVSLANTNFWFPYPGSSGLTNVAIPISPSQPNVFFRLVYP
jgi:autotransporter-associated beta strand protein